MPRAKRFAVAASLARTRTERVEMSNRTQHRRSNASSFWRNLHVVGQRVPQFTALVDGRQRCGFEGASLVDIVFQHFIDDCLSGRAMRSVIERDMPLHVIDEGWRERRIDRPIFEKRREHFGNGIFGPKKKLPRTSCVSGSARRFDCETDEVSDGLGSANQG